MKRWFTVGIVLLLLLASAILILRQGVDPENYLGDWYCAGDGTLYRFREGILECEKYGYWLSDGSVFSGAYTFSRNCVVVFLVGAEGPEAVKELHLARSPQGNVLREGKYGEGKVVFYRNREAAVQNR